MKRPLGGSYKYLEVSVKIIKQTLFTICIICFASITQGFAYEEANLEEVMTELKSTNSALYKKADKVYKYATKNTNEIIDKPLLTKHNKALNGFVDRNNRVSAKFYASGSGGVKAIFVMLFKFDGKKYKVIENFTRAEKCKKFSVCAPWIKVD